MNLRLSKNYLRLRLLPSDIEALRHENHLVEKLEIGESLFLFRIHLRPDSNIRLARILNGEIVIDVDENEFRHWLDCSEVEYEFYQNHLRVQIEKDLKPHRGE